MRDGNDVPHSGDPVDFEFDAESGEITGPEATVRIAPQPAALLELLAASPGEVVGRDRIVQHLWPDGKVEFEQGIAFAVREIRDGLEAAGFSRELVETLPRRGYRLKAEASSGEDVVEAPTGRTARRPALMGVLALIAAAIVAGALLGGGGTPVLALVEHRAGSPSVEPLATALGTTITTLLTDSLAGTAGIVGPTGTGALAGPDDLEGARARLDACLVISGSVTELTEDSVVVFTQMVRTTDRVHVWARMDTVASDDAVRSVSNAVLAGARESAPEC